MDRPVAATAEIGDGATSAASADGSVARSIATDVVDAVRSTESVVIFLPFPISSEMSTTVGPDGAAGAKSVASSAGVGMSTGLMETLQLRGFARGEFNELCLTSAVLREAT